MPDKPSSGNSTTKSNCSSPYIKLMVNAVLLFKEFMLFFMVVDIKNNYFNPQGVVKKKYFNPGADVSRLSL